MSYSSRRNYQYEYQSKGHREYQKKDSSKRYPERDYPDSSQRESDRQSNKDSGKKAIRSNQQQLNGPSIKIQSKPRIIIFGGLPRSQIRDHFVFNPMQIDPKHQEAFIEVLRKYFEKQYGSVSHLSQSDDSKPGSLIMKLGFQNDSAAVKALERKIDEVTITIDEKLVKVSAKPTLTFKALLSYQDKNKKQKSTKSYSSQRSNDRERSRNKNNQKKDKRDSKIRRHSRSSSLFSSRSSSSSKKKNPNQKNNKKYDRSTQSRREQASHDRSGSVNQYKKYDKHDKSCLKKDENQSKGGSFERDFTNRVQVGSQNRGNQYIKKYKKLLFWGIPTMINAKRMDEFLQTHRDGKFVSKKQLSWKKFQGSKFFNILQGQFEQKDAQKLLRTEVPMKIDNHPFIVIDSELQDKRKYVQKLSQYQVNIKFPKEVEPYYVMKSLQQCGKVIQVVSNNKFTESGLSDSYNVTFASKEVCKNFKAIKKTSKGISIYEICSVDQFVPIYRPTQKLQQESEMEPQNQQISQRFSVSPFKSLSPMRSL